MKKYLLYALAGALLAACGKDETDDIASGPDAPGGAIRFEIGFAPQAEAVQTAPHTRVATDTKFNSTWEEGDEIGVYAVEHGTKLAASGNFIHNVKLTYDGSTWTASKGIYWPKDGTKYDFYAYYPYDETASDPSAIAFSVHSDQSATTNIGGTEKSNFSLSGLLTAKAEKRGKGETVQLSFTHALAMVQVNVSKSMVGDYAPDALHVRLNGCTADCVLDLSAQTATQPSPSASPEQIKMYPCPNDGNAPGIYAYRALVPVQTIASGTVLFSFDYNGSALLRSRPLATGITLAAGRAEPFDMTFPFTSATVSSNVRLTNLFTTDELAKITHLKVLGEMTEMDFATIKNMMSNVTSLDLGGATVKGNAIPNNALLRKTSLEEFVFPRNIKTIGNNAFYNCNGLTGDLTIPEGVTTIGNNAFYNCNGFTGDLTIPEGVTTIGNEAFRECSGFTGDLTIPEGVTTIGNEAFYYCNGFTGDLKISKGVTSIGEYAFYKCSGFTGSLTISEGVTSIGNHAFRECYGFKGSLTIPKGVKSIGNYAFHRCSGFTGSLTIPEEVTSIGEYAFFGCSGFTGSLTIPKSVTIGKGAFLSCSGFTGDLTIPKGVTTIGDFTFQACSGFKGSLTISKGVTSIGASAFAGCNGFKGSLTIPQGVTTIGGDAFLLCSGFDGSLTIPEGVTSIGNGAFKDCENLRSIICHLSNPNSVSYGSRVFYGLSTSVEVYVPAEAMEDYKKHDTWMQFILNLYPIKP